MNSELSLLLGFDTDDPQFVRGFELGRLWSEVRSSEEEVVAVVHVESAEMVLRIAEATERTVVGTEIGDGWLEVAFSAASVNAWEGTGP